MALLKDVAMSVRNDPAYKDVFLDDPTLLGVDSIKGSQIIYPVQLKTKANQQWAAMRETQRRIRIALADHTCSLAIRCASTTPLHRMGPLPASPNRRPHGPRTRLPPSRIRSTRSREKACPKGRAQGSGNREQGSVRGGGERLFQTAGEEGK